MYLISHRCNLNGVESENENNPKYLKIAINKEFNVEVDIRFEKEKFNEKKFNKFCKTDKSEDLQGSHLAPHLVHKKLWKKVGGFSEEFNPGDGSDPDFCMKLWINKVKIFKTISKFKVYHFSSITTRKRNVILNNGTKTFILKFGFNPRFFRKYYLKSNGSNPFNGKLVYPKMNFKMLFEYLVNKVKFFYFKITN